MRLSISNIAWDIVEDETIKDLLYEFHVDAIDIVPGKYFPKPEKATDKEINKVKNWWSSNGIEIVGMQALLFGKTEMNVFGTKESRLEMLKYLKAICQTGSVLGAKRIVFGSPKNRDCTGLNELETKKIATDFFQRLGDIAESAGVIICLEPCPASYGGNFMKTSTETAKMITIIRHPAIKMQLDSGAISINNEDPFEILFKYAELIGHVHASEPNLVPLGDGTTNHKIFFKALTKYLPSSLVSIEMVATQNESHLASIKRSLLIANKIYKSES